MTGQNVNRGIYNFCYSVAVSLSITSISTWISFPVSIMRLQFMNANLSNLSSLSHLPNTQIASLQFILLKTSIPWSWVVLCYLLMVPSIAAVLFYSVSLDFDGSKFNFKINPQNIPTVVTEKALTTGAAGLFMRFLPALMGGGTAKEMVRDWLDDDDSDQEQEKDHHDHDHDKGESDVH